jgi:hypothetical protein
MLGAARSELMGKVLDGFANRITQNYGYDQP